MSDTQEQKKKNTRAKNDLFKAAANEPMIIQAFRDAESSQQVGDVFAAKQGRYGGQLGELQVIKPPYNPSFLQRLPIESSILRQCIDATVTNTEAHGYMLDFDEEYYVETEDGESTIPEAAEQEKKRIEQLMDYPNEDYTGQELRERLRRDLENTGNAYIEVVRNKKSEVDRFYHLPSATTRLTSKEKEAVDVDVYLPRSDGDTKKVAKKFKRFVQKIGTKKIWFKEFGDPRKVSWEHGKADDTLKPEDEATEIIHIRLYDSDTPYGLPRWINQLPNILGLRQSELTNLDFFKDNAIPALAVLVSGGSLSERGMRALEETLTQVRGRDAVNRVLLLESTFDEEAQADSGAAPAPRLDIKPLAGERQSDAMFQEYENRIADKIRSSFRLAPLFIGLTTDYTYATAKTSFEVTESQLFEPERRRFDDIVNFKILPTLGVKYWRFKSKSPTLTDPQDIVSALNALGTSGAMTPNQAIAIANEHFNLEIELIAHAWGNYPMEIVRMLANKVTLSGSEEVGEALDNAAEDLNDESEEGADTDENATEEGEEADTAPDQNAEPEEEDANRVMRKALQAIAATVRTKAEYDVRPDMTVRKRNRPNVQQ